MDLEYYRNFIAIVEAENISTAAKRVNIAQPSLSNQLKILQANYGATLIETQRGGHKIELTDAGAILYNKAKYILSMEADARREIADNAAGFVGTLKITLSPSMSIAFIKKYLVGFSKLYPQINYELHEVAIDEQTSNLLNGVSEIGIANVPLLEPVRFETIVKQKERLHALFHKDSPYLNSTSPNILLDDLEETPLCLSRGCSSLFLDTCSDSCIFPHVLSITTTKLAAIAWASKNCGVAVVPLSVAETVDDVLVDKVIQDERLYLEKSLCIVKGRRLSNVAKKFIQYLRENTLAENW